MSGAEKLAYLDGVRAKRRGEPSDANPYADLKGRVAATLPPLARLPSSPSRERMIG